MDTKFPHHPLMPSEAAYKKNVEAAELNMLRKTMGAAMPLKLSMERKAASKVVTLGYPLSRSVEVVFHRYPVGRAPALPLRWPVHGIL